MSPFFMVSMLLFSRNSTCRTYGFARAAVDAAISYNVFCVAFFNGFNRTSRSTSTAFYAFVGNNMHVFSPPTLILFRGLSPFVFLIIARNIKNVNAYRIGNNIGIYLVFEVYHKKVIIFSSKKSFSLRVMNTVFIYLYSSN